MPEIGGDRRWLLGCMVCSGAGAIFLVSTPKERWTLQARGAAGIIVGGTMNSHLMHVGALWATCVPQGLTVRALRAAMIFLPLYSTVAIHKGLPKMPIVYALGALCAVVQFTHPPTHAWAHL